MISFADPARAVKRTPLGVVLYEGPSKLDGEPIVCVATFGSKNAKTGPMVQTWILRADVPPIRAINTGADISVCDDCPLRGRLATVATGGHPLGASDGETTTNCGRGCYVRIDQAPTAVYYAYHNGSYPRYSPAEHNHLFQGRMIRLGAYGDPVAVPLAVFKPILTLAKGWTGYTHQWAQGVCGVGVAMSTPARTMRRNHRPQSAKAGSVFRPEASFPTASGRALPPAA